MSKFREHWLGFRCTLRALILIAHVRVIPLTISAPGEKRLIKCTICCRNELASRCTRGDPNDVTFLTIAYCTSDINTGNTTWREFAMCNAGFAKINCSMASKWTKKTGKFRGTMVKNRNFACARVNQMIANIDSMTQCPSPELERWPNGLYCKNDMSK